MNRYTEDVVHLMLRKSMASLVAFAGYDGESFFNLKFFEFHIMFFFFQISKPKLWKRWPTRPPDVWNVSVRCWLYCNRGYESVSNVPDPRWEHFLNFVTFLMQFFFSVSARPHVQIDGHQSSVVGFGRLQSTRTILSRTTIDRMQGIEKERWSRDVGQGSRRRQSSGVENEKIQRWMVRWSFRLILC